MGAKDLSPYLIDNPQLDSLLESSDVERKLRYFNVPVLLKYRFKNHFSIEVGPQFGLLSKAFDEFKADIIAEEDLTYKRDIIEEYHRIDFGLTAGAGYKLLNGTGMNIGIRYYYGLTDITKTDSPTNMNRSFYAYVGIPIGRG